MRKKHLKHTSSFSSAQELDLFSLPTIQQETPLYLSNSLETLSAYLVENIVEVQSRALSSRNLKKHLIVVSSHEKKTWLRHKLAQFGISLLDIDIMILNDFFSFLKGGRKSLSWHSLLLPALSSILTERNTKLENEEVCVSHAESYEYKTALSLFRGNPFPSDGENFVSMWKELKETVPELFWNYKPAFENGYVARSYASISIFGISSLSQSMLQECLEIVSSGSLAGFFYVLSPCLHFWSDVKTSEEVRRLLDIIKKKDTSSDLFRHCEMALSQRNELLGNLGILSREFSKEIEEKPFHTIPVYSLNSDIQQKEAYRDLIIPEYLSEKVLYHTKQSQRLLQSLQADILCFVPRRNEKEHLAHPDSSIQLVISSTILQEVEAFYSYLLQEKGSQLHPLSAIVLVPSLQDYYNAFTEIFHGEQPIRVQFWNGSYTHTYTGIEENEFYTWICRLFAFLGEEDASSKRDSSYAMMALSFHPTTLHAVLKNTGEDDDTKERGFYQYLEKMDPDWFISLAHMKREMELQGIDMRHTDRMHDFCSLKEWCVQEFVSGYVDEGKAGRSFSNISDREVHNSFLSLASFFESCEEVWNIPLRATTMKTIQEWVQAIQTTFKSLEDLDEIVQTEDLESFEIVVQRFMRLSHRFPDIKLPFSWFSRSFKKEFLYEIHTRRPEKLEGHIIVAERSKFDCIPSPGLAILGATQDQFPYMAREHVLSHLEIMSPSVPSDPSVLDKELFLEVILSASSWCYISTLKAECEKQGDPIQSFSPLIRELVRYIDDNFKYADGEHFSQKNVRQIHYRDSLQPVSKTLGDNKTSEIFTGIPERHKEAIPLKDLLETAKDPLGAFFIRNFQTKIGSLYTLLRHDTLHEERMKPSSRAHNEAFLHMLEKKFSQKTRPYGWPKGYIGLISEKMVQKKVEALSDKKSPFSPLDLFLFDHEYGHEEDTSLEQITKLDAICLLGDSQETTLILTGRLRHLSIQSFFLVSDAWKNEIYQRFPEYLVRAFIYFRNGFGSLSIQWMEKECRHPIFTNQAEVETTLKDWLQFTKDAVHTMYPFTGLILDTLLKIEYPLIQDEREKAIEKCMEAIHTEKNMNTAIDIVLPLFSYNYIDSMLDVWLEWANRLYRPLYVWCSTKPFESQSDDGSSFS